MSRRKFALILMVLGVIGFGEAQAQAWPFIPKKPEDVLPHKPEDLLPKLNTDTTQFVGETKIHFDYTIWNNSGTSVRFRLPSGKIYVLSNGERGSYTFTGYRPEAKVYVFNTGRDYDVTGGRHKFWWMAQQQRIGFDLNYK